MERATKRVAVDMDSTLANTMTTVYELAGLDYCYDDQTHWDFPIEAFGSHESFMSVINEVWSDEWHRVPPAENRVCDPMQRLSEVAHVDVVTAQPSDESITQGKRAWLEAYQIPYENIVTVPLDRCKGELNYTDYVDDKTEMPPRVDRGTVYLRDRPHNRDADGDYIRVSSIDEAAKHICNTAAMR